MLNYAHCYVSFLDCLASYLLAFFLKGYALCAWDHHLKEQNLDRECHQILLSSWLRGFFYLLSGAECTTVTVSSGDSCWAMANTCVTDLPKYSPQEKSSAALVPGYNIRCSYWMPPSAIPPVKEDGCCPYQTPKGGDGCPSMISKCGFNGCDFERTNKMKVLWSILTTGQQVAALIPVEGCASITNSKRVGL